MDSSQLQLYLTTQAAPWGILSTPQSQVLQFWNMRQVGISSRLGLICCCKQMEPDRPILSFSHTLIDWQINGLANAQIRPWGILSTPQSQVLQF